MPNTKHFIRINPAAEADVTKMNEILKADNDYITGVEFHSEVIDDGSVQFSYNHPEEFTPEQSANARQLVNRAHTNFMASRIVTG